MAGTGLTAKKSDAKNPDTRDKYTACILAVYKPYKIAVIAAIFDNTKNCDFAVIAAIHCKIAVQNSLIYI